MTLTRFSLVLPALGALFTPSAQADEPPCPFYENRSGLCGYYHSEISPAEAFVDTVVKRGKWSDPQLRPVILDVRSTPEYKAGHPEHAVNVPYPYIYQYCDSQGRSPDGACVKKRGPDCADRRGLRQLCRKHHPGQVHADLHPVPHRCAQCRRCQFAHRCGLHQRA